MTTKVLKVYCGAIAAMVSILRIIIRKQMTEQERIQHKEQVRAHLIEQDKRTAFMRHLYHIYGRNNPDHPIHGHLLQVYGKSSVLRRSWST